MELASPLPPQPPWLMDTRGHLLKWQDSQPCEGGVASHLPPPPPPPWRVSLQSSGWAVSPSLRHLPRTPISAKQNSAVCRWPRGEDTGPFASFGSHAPQ